MKNDNKTSQQQTDAYTAHNTGDNSITDIDAIVTKQNLHDLLMDSLEVMKLFTISRGTLYNWRRHGYLCFSKVGGRIYFNSADVNKMLVMKKQHRRKPGF